MFLRLWVCLSLWISSREEFIDSPCMSSFAFTLTGFTRYDKSLGPSILLKMTFFFHSFQWLSVLPCFDGQFPRYFSIDGQFGLCSVLDIVNNAALKIGVQPSFSVLIFYQSKTRSGLAGPCGKCMFSVQGISILFSSVAAPTHFHPHPQCRRIPCFPCPLQHFILVDLLEDDSSEGCQWYLVAVWLAFL